jgi:ketosteroid isomerase-like protein
MSAENVEIIRRGYAEFIATGAPTEDIMAPEFVWDMSTFRGWPERKTYEGVDGMREFLADWTAAWEDWRLELEDLIDAETRSWRSSARAAARRRPTFPSTCALRSSGPSPTASRPACGCTRTRKRRSAPRVSRRACRADADA